MCDEKCTFLKFHYNGYYMSQEKQAKLSWFYSYYYWCYWIKHRMYL